MPLVLFLRSPVGVTPEGDQQVALAVSGRCALGRAAPIPATIHPFTKEYQLPTSHRRGSSVQVDRSAREIPAMAFDGPRPAVPCSDISSLQFGTWDTTFFAAPRLRRGPRPRPPGRRRGFVIEQVSVGRVTEVAPPAAITMDCPAELPDDVIDEPADVPTGAGVDRFSHRGVATAAQSVDSAGDRGHSDPGRYATRRESPSLLHPRRVETRPGRCHWRPRLRGCAILSGKPAHETRR